MSEPLWLTRPAVDLLHHDLVVEHGGRPGTRDENLLESTLARPRNRWQYEGTRDLAELAAVYGHGIARAHPYVDGNKRIAFLAMAVFLDANGSPLEAPDDEVVTIMRGIAAGSVDEQALAEWLRGHLVPA